MMETLQSSCRESESPSIVASHDEDNCEEESSYTTIGAEDRIERQMQQYSQSLERILNSTGSDLSNSGTISGPSFALPDQGDDDDDLRGELIALKYSGDTLRDELLHARFANRMELEPYIKKGTNLTTIPLQDSNEAASDDEDYMDYHDSNHRKPSPRELSYEVDRDEADEVAYIDHDFYANYSHRNEQQLLEDEDESEHDQLPSVEEYKADIQYNAKFSFMPQRSKQRPDPPDFYFSKWQHEVMPIVLEEQEEEEEECHDTENQRERLVLPENTSEVRDGMKKPPSLGVAARSSCCCFRTYVAIFLSLVAIILMIVRFGLTEDENAVSLDHGGTRLRDVQLFLAENGYSNLELLQTPESPQYRAAAWIADVDPQKLAFGESNPSDSSTDFIYRYALAVLFYSLGGDSGTWLSDLNFLSGDHVCKWMLHISNDMGEKVPMGVHKCYNIGGEVVPVGLTFALHGLRGTMPDEIRLLDRLESLILHYNPGIGGSIPQSMSTLSHLKVLSVQHCSLSGPVPDWIGQLEGLTNLGLGSNRLTGTIPASIQSLRNLKALGLDNNMLAADLEGLGSLSNLQYLYLDNNMIHGSLSSSLFTSWHNLLELDLSENYVSSTLPADLFSHEHMRVLDLHSNRITGSIPDVRKHGSKTLEYLALHENELEWVIPKSLGMLRNLRHLDLSMNRLAGSLPATIGTMTRLEYLFVGQNRWNKGAIPNLELLTDLRELSLKESGLTGTIPDSLGYGLSNLTFLDLGENFLTGSIPESIGFLSDLDHLLLNRNDLSGSLPGSFVKLSLLDVLLLDKNSISGDAQVVCQKRTLEYFAADCSGGQPEIRCACCTLCCYDGDDPCNDLDWYGNLDFSWDSRYERGKYEFGIGELFER